MCVDFYWRKGKRDGYLVVRRMGKYKEEENCWEVELKVRGEEEMFWRNKKNGSRMERKRS